MAGRCSSIAGDQCAPRAGGTASQMNSAIARRAAGAEVRDACGSRRAEQQRKNGRASAASPQRPASTPRWSSTFFGSKEDLFRQVMALTPAIAHALEHLADGPRETVGRRLAELVVAALVHPDSRAVVLGRIRRAVTHPDAAALVRETVTRDLRKLAQALTDDRLDVRAVLLGAHVVGVALARYVVLVEPLDVDEPSGRRRGHRTDVFSTTSLNRLPARDRRCRDRHAQWSPAGFPEAL